MPDSLDAYYQEIGRAGRDGEPATAVLFYRPEDLGLRRFFSSSSADPIVLQRVAKLVGLHDGPIAPAELRTAAQLSATRLTAAVNLLEEAGALTVDRRGRVVVRRGAPDPPQAAEAAVEVAEARKRVEVSRVEMVRGYAETPGCRRQFLLAYFGESYDDACGNCDRCADGSAGEATGAEAIGAWRVNDRVTHDTWGDGVVMRCEADRVTVLFEQVGYKTLKLDAVTPAA